EPAAPGVRREAIDALEPPGEEAAAERRVGDEADVELLHHRQDFVLRIAAPPPMRGLQRGERMDLVCAPDGRSARFRKAEMAHLAGPYELRHGADRLLDRH